MDPRSAWIPIGFAKSVAMISTINADLQHAAVEAKVGIFI
jgi:hypothetical protein